MRGVSIIVNPETFILSISNRFILKNLQLAKQVLFCLMLECFIVI